MSEPSRAARYQHAQQLYAAKRYPEAMAILDALAREMPEHPDLLYARTLCLSASGQKDEALRLCDRLIAIHGHAKAQHLKTRILAREPEPNLIELGPVGAAMPASGRPRRRWAAVAVLLALVASAGAVFAYLEWTKGDGALGGSGLGRAAPVRSEAPAVMPAALQGGEPVSLVNQTTAHVDVWVDQTAAGDAPALRIAPGASQEISLRAGERRVRVRATFDERTRFHTVPQVVVVDGPGTLTFTTQDNELGVTEVTVDFQ